MNDYCKLCGAPVPIGSDAALCWQQGGYPLTPESQIRCPFCRELILAEAKKILPVPLSFAHAESAQHLLRKIVCNSPRCFENTLIVSCM